MKHAGLILLRSLLSVVLGWATIAAPLNLIIRMGWLWKPTAETKAEGLELMAGLLMCVALAGAVVIWYRILRRVTVGRGNPVSP